MDTKSDRSHLRLVDEVDEDSMDTEHPLTDEEFGAMAEEVDELGAQLDARTPLPTPEDLELLKQVDMFNQRVAGAITAAHEAGFGVFDIAYLLSQHETRLFTGGRLRRLQHELMLRVSDSAGRVSEEVRERRRAELRELMGLPTAKRLTGDISAARARKTEAPSRGPFADVGAFERISDDVRKRLLGKQIQRRLAEMPLIESADLLEEPDAEDYRDRLLKLINAKHR